MSRDIPVESLLFGVEQVPIEAVWAGRRILVPGKKALLNAATGGVLVANPTRSPHFYG